VADRIALVARELNKVASAGQARAAISAARTELARGLALAPQLSPFSTPDPGEAYQTLAVLRTALDTEDRGLSAQAADSPVDAQAWSRARREVERVYIEVSGLDGVVGQLDRVDVISILANAIADAPRVFGEGVGQVVAGAGEVVGSAGAGILSGLGVVGVVVLVVVVVVLIKGAV
jgi:hypothetical protein